MDEQENKAYEYVPVEAAPEANEGAQITPEPVSAGMYAGGMNVREQPGPSVQYATPNQGMPVMADPYIMRLQQEQLPKQEPRKKSFFGRAVLFVTSAILFGVLAAGAYIGVQKITKHFEDKKTESADKPDDGSSELDVKHTGSGGIVLQASQQIRETTVTALDVSSVAENAMPSVVAINNYSLQSYSFFFSSPSETVQTGSGIIIGQNETEVLIVTNAHVVDGAERLSINFVDGTTADAAVKGAASASDLAVVAVKFEDLSDETIAAIRVARLGDSDSVKVGEIAIAVGNALGYGQSVTVGYISAKERTVTTEKATLSLIQTDAAINPGNSGGALLNKNGEVIGINSAKYVNQKVEGVGFAIPISNVMNLINELSNRETLTETEMGYLGIERGTDITDDIYTERFNIPKGLYVQSIQKGSAADKGGIIPGDIIVRVDNVIIYGMGDLQDFLSYTKAGTEVEIVVYRSNKGVYEEQVLKVTLGSRPKRRA